MSTSLWFARRGVVAAYTDDAAVRAVALSLVGFVAIFHCFDAVQGMSGFILRAYRHAVAPMLVYTVSLWGIGLVGGWWIAFHPVVGPAPLGVKGLWVAATIEPRTRGRRAARLDAARVAPAARRGGDRRAQTRRKWVR